MKDPICVSIVLKEEGVLYDDQSWTTKVEHVFGNPLDAYSELAAHGTPNKDGKVTVSDANQHRSIYWVETHQVK